MKNIYKRLRYLFFYIPINWFQFWIMFFKWGGFKRYGVPFGKEKIKSIRKNIRRRKDNKKAKGVRGSLVQSKKKRIVKIQLIKQHGSVCQMCHKYFSFDSLTIDHIRKLSDGGGNDIENLQLLCRPCHTLKDTYGAKPLPKPIYLTNILGEPIKF